MKILLVVVVLVTLAAIALAYVKKRSSSGGGTDVPWLFYAKRPLTQPEQILYHRLVKALPEHIVLAQVLRSRRPNFVDRVFQQVLRISEHLRTSLRSPKIVFTFRSRTTKKQKETS